MRPTKTSADRTTFSGARQANSEIMCRSVYTVHVVDFRSLNAHSGDFRQRLDGSVAVRVRDDGDQSMSDTNSDQQVQGGGKGWFTDDQGSPSSMRLMSMLALIVAAGLACIQVFGWGSGDNKTELVLYFLVAAFAPKAVQKFAETPRK